MSKDLNEQLIEATHAVLNEAFRWADVRQKDAFEAAKLASWPAFLDLLERGGRLAPDAPFDREDRPFLDMLEWNTYCLWNDDALADVKSMVYEQAGQAVLAQLVEHGFTVRPEDVASNTHLNSSDYIDLVVLAARSKELLLQGVLPDDPLRTNKPRF